MPLDKTIEFTPVVTGNMKEVPPDLPGGHWNASFVVKNRVNKDNYPQIQIDVTVSEDLTGENESYVGSRATIWWTFYPEQHPNSKYTRQDTKAFADAHPDAPELDTAALQEGNWESLEPWVEYLEANQQEIWSIIDKRGQTKIMWTAPGQKLALKPEPAAEEEEEEKPKAKTNGHAKKGKR